MIKKTTALLLLLLLSGSAVFAHATVVDVEKMAGADAAALYLMLGFTHILPMGLDHILFVLGLFLLKPQLKPVLLQATAFTLAHTVTLGLSMYRIIHPPAAVVEPLIALSILFVALENILSQKIKRTRLAVVFIFGLVHGMGFASALGELGLPQNRFFSSLLLFNIGVELGQAAVILAAWLLLAKWFGHKTYYRKFIVIPFSAIIGLAALYFLFTRISFKKEAVVIDTALAENIISNYNDSALKKNDTETAFWKNRIQPNTTDYTNSIRYAAALMNRFHISGDIGEVKKSDSVLLSLTRVFKTDAAPYLALSSHAILQHDFVKADSFFTIAKNTGLKKYDAAAAGFDVNFELGNISFAAMNLKQIQSAADYGYQFRRSKFMHYTGAADSAVSAMKTAYELSGSNAILKQAALSNLGDLYMHTGEMKKAADCFTKCIKEYGADMHSLLGLGWIALVYDRNADLAEKIFHFAASKTASPEPVFRLVAAAQLRHDTAQEHLYATQFETAASSLQYGNMYNKYLIQLYTGVLHNTRKAVTIAAAELGNRNTPQTQAWYAWALYNNGQQQEAIKVFNEKVSGKPLEALELYWMGKLLKAVHKTGTATQYFYEAAKNKYDLPPAIINDLETLLQ